jgi:hypothetical protein
MSDNLADSTARLEQLVARIMKETDPVKYDEIGSEIWRALSERERLMKPKSPPIEHSGESTIKNVARAQSHDAVLQHTERSSLLCQPTLKPRCFMTH